MKLHLPIGLRVALFAVMSALPVTFGAVSASYTHEDGNTEEVTPKSQGGNKGELSGSYTGGTLVLSVDGSTDGENVITDLNFSVPTKNATTSVTVGKGGALNFRDGYFVGSASSPDDECETEITVNGGTVTLATYFGYVENESGTSKSRVTFNISENGSFSLEGGNIGEIASSSQGIGESFSNINVTGGGSFTVGYSGSYIGKVSSKHGISHTAIVVDGEDSIVNLSAGTTIGNIAAYNGESHTEITITNQGKFANSSSSNFSVGEVLTNDSSSFTTITVSGGGEFLFVGTATTSTIGMLNANSTDEGAQKHTGYTKTTINVNEGGKFTHQGGSIATCTGVSKQVADGVAIPMTELEFNVDGGVYTVENDPANYDQQIGYANANGKYAASTNTVINVTNGGQFNVKGHRVRIAYADAQKSVYGAEATLTIKVSNKGVFSVAPERTNNNPGVCIGDTQDGTTEVTVEVSNEGTFSMLKAGDSRAIEVLGGAWATTAGRENPASSAVNIKLYDQGTMTLQTADHSTMTNKLWANGIGICRTQSGGNANVETTISIGDQSTFKFESGDIGMAFVDGAGTATSATSIIVEEGGTFTMEGGYLSHSYASRATGPKPVDQTLSIKLNGGDMTITGGNILTLDAANSMGESTRKGSIDISGDSILTIDNGVTIGDGVEFAITMHGGRLEGDGISQLSERISTVIIDTGEGFKGTVDLGGLSGEKISEVKINEAGARITGLQAGSSLTLTGSEAEVDKNVITVGSGSAKLTKGGTSSDSGEKKNIIEFQGEGGTIQLADGCKVTLNFGEDEFLGELSGQEDVEIQVYLTNAQLSATTDGDIVNHFKLGAGWGLSVKSYTVTENGDGILILTGDTTGVVNLNGTQDNFTGVSDADKVVVTGDTTLTSTEEQGGTLKHLQGGHNLTVKGEGEVELHNDGDLFNADGNTTFGGKLATEKGVTLKKTGEDSLTLGSLEAGGNVTVEEGTLVLTGDDDSIGGTLTLGDKGALQVDGKLTLNGQGNDLSGATSDQLTGEGSIVVGDGGSLRVSSEMLTDEDLPGFVATEGGTLEFTDKTPVNLEKLSEDTTGTVKGSFTSNADGAAFAGSIEGALTVEGGSLNMSNTANEDCDLVVGSGSSATLAAGSTYHSIDNKGTLSTSIPEGTENACITATGDIIFRNGAHSPVDIDLNEPGLSQGSSVKEINYASTGGRIIIEQGTELDITLTGNILDAKGDLNVVIMEAAEGILNLAEYEEGSVSANNIQEEILSAERARRGNPNQVIAKSRVILGEDVNEAVMDQLYDVGKTTFWTDGKQLFTHIPQRTESPWEQYATTSNSRAGLGLLYRELHQNGVMETDQDVVELINGINRLVESNPAGARRALAAVAGSTLTSVSAAQSAALRNQMDRVRDHALQAARLRCMGNDEATAQQRLCKNSHVWVEGTGFFSEQHSVGDESGYRLNSWGGAVGIDAQVDAHWSVGVSLSASYGDLEAHAADDAKGDLDTYTVSFWSQAKNGRWGNTLLFTLGTNEADLKRTVNYGAGSYTATSNASGSSLGAMWELTYDFHPVKDNKSNILQPLFNVAVMHTSMDGFSEKNAGNVGLAAEKQTRDTVTLGLGLRWLAAINSAKAVNRTVTTELHANVAQDLGDRRSETNVALLADPNFTQRVYGSKTGSTAFQFGAGVNVPVTPNSQIYVNAGGELREHANAWNAALGVRMGF